MQTFSLAPPFFSWWCLLVLRRLELVSLLLRGQAPAGERLL